MSPAAFSIGSGWQGAEKIFTTPEFQKRYSEVEISLITPKYTLVPQAFCSAEQARKLLSDCVLLSENDVVETLPVEEYGLTLVYSNSLGERLSSTLSEIVRREDGSKARVVPDVYVVLKNLGRIPGYNKIVASYMDGKLHLAIAQGATLMLCNVFEAADFVTAEYFIFLSLQSLQLNPEQSTIYFRTDITSEQEISLYRYFKSVEPFRV